MFGGGGSSAPPPPKPPPPPPTAPTPADTTVIEAGQATRSKGRTGIGSTVATGSGGLSTPATTSSKSLLGD